ncbi:hypothetical protein H5410_022403, partial [Solanum commersonii]
MGKPSTSYGKLPRYLYALDKTYPGSHIRMKKTLANEFLYLRPTKFNTIANITVLIQHFRKWLEENCYVKYSIDRTVLKEYASYFDLVDLISIQLNIDLTKKCMKIKYIVEGNDTPMKY